MQRWPRPAKPPMPPIPIGTDSPNLSDFEAALLADAIESGKWRETAVSATKIEMGYAAKMPDFASDPDSTNSREHQRAIVRRYAREVLAEVRKYGPMTFIFHWGLKRVETHIITCPAELLAYVLKGPDAFFALGGAISRAGPDVRPPRNRAKCPTCGANKGMAPQDGTSE